MLELLSNPTIFFFIVGLVFVLLGIVIAKMDNEPKVYNDKYTPTEAVTSSKRKQRYS